MNRPVSKEIIVKEMAKMGIETTDRSVREHVRKIRKEFKKVKLEPIKTIRGQGYSWVMESCDVGK
ncbi:helix-turn-helix domain-containing protein [Anaerococcus hydrogenalis]|nr:helix-turn-helix domain-containing protein [Anaerococcus hydrogenalis]